MSQPTDRINEPNISKKRRWLLPIVSAGCFLGLFYFVILMPAM